MRTHLPLLAVAVGLLAPALATQDPAAELEALLTAEAAARTELRHAGLLAAYTKLAESTKDDESLSRQIAERMAMLGVEQSVLQKGGAPDALRRLKPARLAAKLAPLDKNADEELALARWLFHCGAVDAGEDALARARDLDPKLKKPTDELLASMRDERVPRGGYHRYRGEFLPLDVRDRARALDEALEGLHGLGLDRVRLPFVPSAETSNLERFAKLGPEAPDVLRTAAAAVRGTLAPDYEEVRGWLSSYARNPGLREQILKAYEALAPKRKEALDLIARYEKPQQPDVDRLRAELESEYAAFEKLAARDRVKYDRTSPQDAFALLDRVRAREGALVAVHAYLSKHAKPGLPSVELTRAEGAATSTKRILPGRAQSQLEDVLWLVAHLRAGQARDAMDRGHELMRQTKALTPWERFVVESTLAEAIDQFNARSAFSLDATEREFADILNRYRRVLGLRPFEIEERCNVASRKHSQEMVDLGYFGHVSPVRRNRGPTDRVRLEGYGGGVGENCLSGSSAARGAFEGWYHSPGHHRGMVARSIHLGVGRAESTMWTMVMGGSDLAWRALHRDMSPERRAACEATADELATALREHEPSKRQRQRIETAREAATEMMPDIVPAIAMRAFPAARDARDPNSAAAPALLATILDADLPTGWRALQVAAVAALIDLLRFGNNTATREHAAAVVEPKVRDLFGYVPDAREPQRRTAVVKIRAHWEDVEQWRYRQVDTIPEPPIVPGREGRKGRGDGVSKKAARKVLTKPERLRLARRFGGGNDTERAVDRGLAFLAKTQDEDGAWRARSWVTRSKDFKARTAGLGNGEWDIAMTGMCLLAFVTSGHTTEAGDYAEVVEKGADWLLERIVDYGKFETMSGHYMYSHALATQALCELYAYTADPHVGTGAQLALDYLAFAQEPGSGGWRYEAKQAGDTSVTGWVVMALNSGFKAELDVVGFRDAIRYIDSMTQPGYYAVGYTGRPGFAPENLRLTSVGMTSRLFLGQPPTQPQVALPAWRLVEHLPSTRGADFYYWYYATIALFQVGGDHWKKWNKALKPAMLDLQVTSSGSPYLGSWNPDGAYGRTGGRIYQTALGILILTTYYRYDRAPKVKVAPFTGNLAKATQPFLEALREIKDPTDRAVAFGKMVDEMGPSIVPVLADVVADEKEDLALRKQLAKTFVTLARPQHEPKLLTLLAQKDGAIVEQVVRALVRISSESSVPVLIQSLRHGNRGVRAFSARALGRLGAPEAVGPLNERLKHERDGWAKNEITAALRRIAHRESLAVIVDDALPKGFYGRVAVLESLDLLERSGTGDQILALKSARPELYERCTKAIRQYAESSIVPVLIVLLESDELEVRAESLKLLQAITRQTHGFDPKADTKTRKKAVRAWDDWWQESWRGYAAERR